MPTLAPGRDPAVPRPVPGPTSRARSTSASPAPGPLHRARGQGRRDDRADAGRRPDRRAGDGRGRPAHRAGVTTDELDRVGHEFLVDHGAYPSTLGYRGFPKSLCTSVNEVDLPRHPGLHRAARTATSSTSTSRPSSAACTATPTRPSSSATSTRRTALLVERTRGGAAPGDQGGATRAADQRHRAGHRVLREAVRLRRRARLHRPRHRHGVPLRAGHPALRRPALTTR